MKRFVIDINVGGRQAPNNRPQNTEQQPKLSYNPRQDKKFIEKYSQLDEVRDNKFLDINGAQLKRKGLFRDTYNVKGLSENADGSIQDISEDLSVGSENLKYVKAAGVAFAWKAVSATSQLYQHRSGDSYANAQLNNGIKLGGYAAAIAMSGPAAPVVAAGIAVNEIISGIVGNANYRFDRALEGDQIRNMKVIAGDISYGRRRGGR